MKTFLHYALCLALAGVFSTAGGQTSAPIRQDRVFFPAHIDGRDYRLEAMVYRPDDTARYPLVVFSHGRNGMFPSRDPNMVNGYAALCNALATGGRAVVYFVRRGYGGSDGPDAELQDTAILSGLEGAKDYRAAVEYWRTTDFVLPDRVVVMGQSQGGWVVLACTNIAMDGVLGAVNISGGTNYRLMGTGAVTAAVQDHWVAACTELGRSALVPSFWIYAENDLSIAGPTARRMFNAFTDVGGPAALLMLPPFGGNGHNIVGQPDLFIAPLNEFFAAIGFDGEPVSPPVVGPITGAETLSLGGAAVLTASVSGHPVPTVQWCKDGLDLLNRGNFSGVTTATLRIANLQAADAGTYTLVATNSLGTAVSLPCVVEFPPAAPVILTQPKNQTVASGGTATFTVAATGNPAPGFQWQRQPAGTGPWTSLAEGGGYGGITTATLTITAATTALSGDRLRCVCSNSLGSVSSPGVLLTVSAPPAAGPAPTRGGGGGALSPWLLAALALVAGARWKIQCRGGSRRHPLAALRSSVQPRPDPIHSAKGFL